MFYAQLKAVMEGKAPIDSVSQSTLSFQIYREACKVLGALRCHREQMCDDLAPGIAELVRAEVIRLYGIRRQAYLAPAKHVQAEPAVHRPEFENWI